MKNVLTVLLVAVLVAGCSASKPAGLADNPQVQATQSKVPFSVILPTYLPQGYVLDGARINDQAPAGNRVSAEISFKGPTGSLLIQESNFQDTTAGETHLVKIKNVDAQYQEIVRQDGIIRTLSFQTKDKVSIALMSTSLSTDELIAVAASMLK